MSKRKFVSKTMTVADAVSYAFGELQSLGEECREVCDNMPESLHGSSRYETLDATASELENLEEPEVPETLTTITVTFNEEQPRSRRKGLSRASRCGNAQSALQAVRDALESFSVDGLETAEQKVEETRELLAEAEQELSDLKETSDAIEELGNALDTMIGATESVEFPGMFG